MKWRKKSKHIERMRGERENKLKGERRKRKQIEGMRGGREKKLKGDEKKEKTN